MEIKHVMVPSDFSLPSKMAANYGVALARKARARLTILHVIEPLPSEALVPAEDAARLEIERSEEALQKLSSLLSPEDEEDLDLRIVLKSGNVQKEIVSAAAEQKPQLVVLGTHGRGRLGQLIIGSTTQGVLRKLPIPVLTVCNPIRPVAFGKILFATDLSQSSVEAFPVVLDFAAALHSEVVAVHALKNTARAESGSPDAQSARRGMALLLTAGCQRGMNVQTVVAQGPVFSEVIRTAHETGADVIAIALDRKGVLDRVMLGNTAEQLVRDAHIPILAIPADYAS